MLVTDWGYFENIGDSVGTVVNMLGTFFGQLQDSFRISIGTVLEQLWHNVEKM